MKALIRFLADRLDERSTWRGIILVLSAIGVSVDPALAEAIITAGVAVAGLVEMLLPDPAGKLSTSTERLPESADSAAPAMPARDAKPAVSDSGRDGFGGFTPE